MTSTAHPQTMTLEFEHMAHTRCPVTFVCIGTDRSTGDSLGPYIGMLLERLGYTNVIGTLDHPCHFANLSERLQEVPEGHLIIAIDSTLGNVRDIGSITFKKGSLKPGAGVNKICDPVGDFSIRGMVNVGGFAPYLVLQNTRLSQVVSMAEQIVRTISAYFPRLSKFEAIAAKAWHPLTTQKPPALAMVSHDKAIQAYTKGINIGLSLEASRCAAVDRDTLDRLDLDFLPEHLKSKQLPSQLI